MRDQRSGVILLAAMSVLVSLLVLSAVGLGRSATELLAANRSVAGHQAIHLAEAGLDVVLAEYVAGGPDGVRGDFSCDAAEDWTGCAGSGRTKSLALQGTPLLITIDDIGSEAPTVTSRAVVDGDLKGIRTVIGVSRSDAQQAVFGRDYIELRDTLVDSYDAALGPYGAAIPPDPRYGTLNRSQVALPASWQATIHTNSAESCHIDLEGQDRPIDVFGDALYGEGGIGVIRTSGAVTIYGVRDGRPPLALDPITIPPGLCTGTTLTTSQTLAAGSYCYDAIELESGETVVTDGEVTVYVQDHIRVEGDGGGDPAALKGRVGGIDTPAALTVHYVGTGNVDFREQATLVGTLHAPGARVRFEEGSRLFGAVLAEEFEARDSEIHFDESLIWDDPTDGSSPVSVRLWKQDQP